MFNLNNYNIQKNEVVELIKNSHKWETTEGFVADGVISLGDYDKSNLKVSIFLGKTYGLTDTRVQNHPV